MSTLRCDDPMALLGYDEMDCDAYCETCGNLGSIVCDCGGDICICDNYGDEPCPECQF